MDKDMSGVGGGGRSLGSVNGRKHGGGKGTDEKDGIDVTVVHMPSDPCVQAEGMVTHQSGESP